MSAYAKNYGYFFNSNSGDRTYNAESFEEWLKPFFISGVFNGELQVLAQTTPDMTVKVTAGHANLDGKAATWDSENTMQLSVASGVYDRIDTIVLRRDNVNRTISIEVVTGTASADPQPTAPTRTANTFELVLAQILVGTGVTAITQANITDTRMDSDVCGYVAATVDQIDFDQIYAQYEAWQEDTQDYFTDWFEAIRGQLDEDAAGHLQNEVDDLQDQIDLMDGRIKNHLIDSATYASSLLVTNSLYKEFWYGDNCGSDLRDGPTVLNVPWELTVGCLGTDLNYQYQELRIYTDNDSGHGNNIYRRQKYYYGPNDYRWTTWVSTNNRIDVLNSNIENLVTVTTLEGTTTSSGALELPTAIRNGVFICAYGRTTSYLVFRRDNNYLMVKEPITLAAVASTEVSITVAYIP